MISMTTGGTTAVDVYPSRLSDRPFLVPRAEPTVWTPEDRRPRGPLDPDQLRRYETDGFLFLERFFSESDIQSLCSEFESLRGSREVRDSPYVVLEPQSEAVRSIFAVHQLSEVFAALTRDPRLVEIARTVLDDDVYIHQSRINVKPAFRGKEFYWHSDFETWHVEDGMPRMRALSCSIVLTENNAFNGPLMVIPGSHQVFVSCVGATPENHYQKSLRKQEYGVPDEISLTRLAGENGIAAPTGRIGSVLLFDCNTMHGSANNLSPWPRTNLFFVYNAVSNALVAPYCGLEPRPEYIAARDYEPISPAA